MKIQFKRLFTLSLCLLCFGISSYGQGIKWTEGLNWEQVKARAKAENKYIFVDCYATWCGPCKKMDKDVYPLNIVGEAVNGKFISVKIQMDTTKSDPEVVKQYYATAKEFVKKYSVAGFPTYLFFLPNGEIVHKTIGFHNADKFIRSVKDAQISEKQLYTQIKACRAGEMDINLVPTFIRLLNDGGDKIIALELARSYMKSYLEKLSDAKFEEKANLQFMWDFQEMLNSDDRIYKLLYEKPEIVNNTYGNPTLADLWVENIFKTEYIIPAINSAQKAKREPDWKSLNTSLIKKSDSRLAEVILVNAKHLWYCVIKDWDKACDFEIIRFQRKDLKNLSKEEVCAELNTIAWTLFLYCFNKKQLEQGLAWINEALVLEESNHKPRADHMDTKANLLYKLGRKEEAITVQERAVSLAPNYAELKAGLEKMKSGKQTWLTSEIGVKENRKVK